MKLHKLLFVLPIAFSLTLAACGGGGSAGSPTSAGVLPGTVNTVDTAGTMSTTVSSAAYTTAVMNDRPTAYYHLDGTGSTAYDSSGNGLNATVGSAVIKGENGLVESMNDTSILSPGQRSAAGVVKVAHTSQLQPSNAVSLEAFLHFSSTPSDYTVPVEYGQRAGTAPYGWYFKSGRLVAQFTLSSGVVDVQTPVLATGRSYDIVSTYNGSYARLYVNGSLVASVAKSGTLANYVSGYGLTIGDSGDYSAPAFRGRVDEVAVYAGKALTATQVQNHHAAATSSTATAAPSPTDTPATTTSSSVHYLDDTGCQAFPASDYWNRRIDGATVASNSSAEINWAANQSGSSGAPNFNPHYDYEVVSNSLTQRKISSTSSHRIPANYESPSQTGWPIPSNMGNLEPTADRVSVLIQRTNPPSDCRGWDGYAFKGSGYTWSAYSGDHVEMNKNMPGETCNGVAMLCGEDIEGDLTYYELNANSGNASGTVTRPILHAIHTEFPCRVSGTCGTTYTYAFNKKWGCAHSCARLRLKKSAIARPSDPNAAALYDAMVHYGLDTSENGCCWGFYTMERVNDSGYPTSIPSAVSSFINKLRIKDFEVLQNGSW